MTPSRSLGLHLGLLKDPVWTSTAPEGRRLRMRAEYIYIARHMIALLLKVALALGVFAGMEGFAWVTHRYVMHGALWCWHRSHHQPRSGAFELNDLFAVVFALPAIACFWLGANVSSWWLAPGIGITAYGAVYAIFHDGLVHGRFPTPLDHKGRFWRARLQAHRLHHAVTTKDGCISFGFLWVRPIRALKAELAARRP